MAFLFFSLLLNGRELPGGQFILLSSRHVCLRLEVAHSGSHIIGSGKLFSPHQGTKKE
jgi:hypothetical protein